MENNTKWLTTEQVTEKYPYLTKRAQEMARHRREITYTKCVGKILYRESWVEEYLNRNIVKAAS